MNLLGLLDRCIELGIKIDVNGEDLRIASASSIPHDLVQDIRASKKELVAILKKQQSNKVLANEVDQKNNKDTRILHPVTGVQEWFLNDENDSNYWKMVLIFDALTEINVEFLKKSVEDVFFKHDSLRSVFVKKDDEWKVKLMEEFPDFLFISHDMSQYYNETQLNNNLIDFIEKTKSDIEIEHNGGFRVLYVNTAENLQDKIIFVVHHLIVDAHSMQLFGREVFQSYKYLNEGSRRVPERPASILQLAEWYYSKENAAEKAAQVHGEWLSQLSWSNFRALPFDFPESLDKNFLSTRKEVFLKISKEETQSLLKIIKREDFLGVSLQDLLILMLTNAVSKWTPSTLTSLMVIDSGRSQRFAKVCGIDLSNSIGWVNLVRFLVLNESSGISPAEKVRSYLAQIDAIPISGYLIGDLWKSYIDEHCQKIVKSSIKFNYYGITVNNPQESSRSNGSTVVSYRKDLVHEYSVKYKFPTNNSYSDDCPLKIDTSVVNGEIEVSIEYSKNIFLESTVNKLLFLYRNEFDYFLHHDYRCDEFSPAIID